MAASTLATHRLLSVDEFDRAWAAGVYGPEERLELIEGEVIQKVSPQESPHATATSLCAEEMRAAFGRGFHVRVQLPLLLGVRTKPEPDIAVVVGTIRDYAHAHPTTAVLVIEVSDSTLKFDRARKAALYAAAGIQDYWILDLEHRLLEVHRKPMTVDSKGIGAPFGHKYQSVTQYRDSHAVSPLGAPKSTVAVSDLLP